MFELPVPADDGLLTPEVGPWSTDKHHFLRRYIDGFTTAMKGKRWSGLHYIDLFASAGIEQIEGGPLEWGSALIAAQAPHRFDGLHLCELSRRRFEALSQRLPRFPQPNPPQIVLGDANVEVHKIAASIPPRTLSLAFLDPHGLHLNFETIRALANRRIDLIIFFPDHLDALRNWEFVYHDDPNSNLDRVLGTSMWREAIKINAKSEWATILCGLYKKQIASLGYTFFEEERISNRSGRYLYKLIFCTSAEAGIRIWRGVSLRKPGGQGTFNW
jgi:three-Cys-motif partner protein